MTTTTSIKVEDILQPSGAIPFIRIPERGCIFHDRAARFRMLAADHILHELLRFMADLCDAQQAALNEFPAVPLPTEAQISQCREHGMPLLSVQSWQRDPAWRKTLRYLSLHMQEVSGKALTEPLQRLQAMDSDDLERMADAILLGNRAGIDLAAAPLVAAALQVYWIHMVTTLGAGAFGRGDVQTLCPVCASAPVSSVVRIGGAEQGLRYLNCSLCDTQWHLVRVKCSNCESTKGISYLMIEGEAESVKAESCDECGSYLKIMYMDKDPHMDPVADDLASLALDLLMDDAGVQRSGPNLFLMTSQAAAA